MRYDVAFGDAVRQPSYHVRAVCSGHDGYGEHRDYNTVYEYMLYRAESDLDKTLTKNPVMPNYNLLPTID